MLCVRRRYVWVGMGEGEGEGEGKGEGMSNDETTQIRNEKREMRNEK